MILLSMIFEPFRNSQKTNEFSSTNTPPVTRHAQLLLPVGGPVTPESRSA